MSYPRLAFAHQIPKKIMDGEIVNDLKLDLVLSPEITDFLLYAPERDTLLARQEAFKALLSDDNSEQKLSELSLALSDAEALYKALTTAQSEKTAALVFVKLFDKISHFCSLANTFNGYGTLFSRFCTAINELSCSEKFILATQKSAEINKKITNAYTVCLKTDTENLTAQKPEGIGITASLRACAKELGIEINEKTPTPIILQKGIADALGTLYPDSCVEATEFLTEYRTLITGDLFDYLPEIKFFAKTVSFTKKATENGLPYSFPTLSDKKIIDLKNVYDITLLKKEGTKIVPNDALFTENEPFFYLTGANGGGKTTYVRALGGAALLFLAGMPVFCEGGQASLLSAVYAHFPRDERFEGTGRFLDEKKRVDAILKKQDGNALILLNETFATTGEEKAIEQTGILADTINSSGNLGLYITHQHDLSKTTIPFLGVTVDEQNSNRRTYKIEKKRLPPKSFAKDILEKYRLDSVSLKIRFKG